MAARSPSSLDLAVDESLLRPRKLILGATPSTTLDNQERLVDMPRVIMLDVFGKVETATSAVSFQRVGGTYYIRGRDTMGTGTITTARAYMLCRNQTGVSTVVAQVDVGGTTYDLSFNDTTWSWRQVSAAVTLNSDETEEDIVLRGKLLSVGDVFECAGFLLTTV